MFCGIDWIADLGIKIRILYSPKSIQDFIAVAVAAVFNWPLAAHNL